MIIFQVAPLDMYKEVNTKTNLPAQIELYAQEGNQYDFLFLAKGGGSANKTFLYQQTKALLNPEKLLSFVNEKIKVNTSKNKKTSLYEHVLSVTVTQLVEYWLSTAAFQGQSPNVSRLESCSCKVEQGRFFLFL